MTMKRATILLLLALPFWAAAQSPKGGNASQSAEYQKLKFEQFFDYLNARYVDTLNNETLVEEAITGILSALDPVSYTHLAALTPSGETDTPSVNP